MADVPKLIEEIAGVIELLREVLEKSQKYDRDSSKGVLGFQYELQKLNDVCCAVQAILNGPHSLSIATPSLARTITRVHRYTSYLNDSLKELRSYAAYGLVHPTSPLGMIQDSDSFRFLKGYQRIISSILRDYDLTNHPTTVENISGSHSSARGDVRADVYAEDDSSENKSSTEPTSDNPAFLYLQRFSDQLSIDLGDALNRSRSSNIDPTNLNTHIDEFSWKLRGESMNPFQWEVSMSIHLNRKQIVELFCRAYTRETLTRASGTNEIEEGTESWKSQKPTQTILERLCGVESSSKDATWVTSDKQLLFTLLRYERFVRKTKAYRWLLSRLRQYAPSKSSDSALIFEPGIKVDHDTRKQGPLRKLSGMRPFSCLISETGIKFYYDLRKKTRRGRSSSAVTITFNLDWNPAGVILDQGLDPKLPGVLDNQLCLTGTFSEAQTTTIAEYMCQTWPKTWEPIVTLMSQLVSQTEKEECVYQLPDSGVTHQDELPGNVSPPECVSSQLRARIDTPSSCSISATGTPNFVSEIAEQLGWLASALRYCPTTHGQGVVTCTPVIQDLRIEPRARAESTAPVSGTCRVGFDLKQNTYEDGDIQAKGFCWGPLFRNPILVNGYPIRERSEANTGLEISLQTMAFIIQSNQVVQCDERIIVKGFGLLLVATLITAEATVWHLLSSGSSEERISYIDPEIDKLNISTPEGVSLRSLERCRHFVGWCDDATDMCGNVIAGLDIRTSGLRKPPASLVIDRLYIEGGANFVGGLNMSINKKDQPFWLHREKDYPSLLKWVSLQPIIFYDVSDRRAWLVDGASALLHLVRVSLYLDEHDQESSYDWVFDPTKLRDEWNECTGRQAALKTLKNWDNLNLNLYVTSKKIRDGKSVTDYSTLETRVKEILHSIEILIDRQVKVASQDGVRIPQTLDLRKNIVGFDILDVISPIGPVHTRVKHLGSWGPGWGDLVPAIGITTIFGNGFGDLIRPNVPSRVCSKWRSVPKELDYMTASISTLKMLHERRLTRMEPGLSRGELTRKIVWLSLSETLNSCRCLDIPGSCSTSPVQFIMSKRSWNAKLMPRTRHLVDVQGLQNGGAVIFGHLPLLGLGREISETGAAVDDKDQGEQFLAASTSNTTEGSVRGMLSPSPEGSTLNRLSTLTVPSAEASTNDTGLVEDEMVEDLGTPPVRSWRKWKKWKKWIGK